MFKITNIVSNDDYKYFFPFKEGMAIVVDKNNRYGFVDKNLNNIIECQYYDASDFSEGLARVKTEEYNGHIYYINKEGKTILDLNCVNAGSFSEGLASITQNISKENLSTRLKYILNIKHTLDFKD